MRFGKPENDGGSSSTSTTRMKSSEGPSSEHTHGDYTVGWVCALSKELTAATAMLDCEHIDLPKPPTDPNAYTLGSIGRHNIVIACLPEGQIGTNSAATIATRMVSTFPSIRFGLMVGIGGGIPPKVRLGDVVVSTASGPYPGVAQWDFGKATEGGSFERTGSLNNPPASLLTAITKLKRDHEMRGSQMKGFLDELGIKWPRLASKYLRSDSLEDVLFKAEHSHVENLLDGKAALDGDGGEEDGDDDEEEEQEEERGCRSCDRSQVVKRKPRDMRIHYGLIASGNQVIKDAIRRDELNKDLGGRVLCTEMEAAGLMNNFPCLVIRGICDYADSHKNKVWQEHAAAVAAAYAKELLQYVQPSDVDGEHPVKDLLKQFVETVSATAADVAQVKVKISNQEDREILNWLTPIDYGPQQSDYLKRRQPGTGQWLLDSHAFQIWLSTHKQTLFCQGIPGAGKTILTSIVVGHLHSRFRNDPKTGIAYIYCNYQRQDEQKIDNLLASILKQLAESQPSLSGSVGGLYDQHKKKKTRPSCDEVLVALQAVIATYSQVFIIVDALDECQTAEGCRTRLLSELFNLQTRHNISIFATSRFIPEVLDCFRTNTSVSLEIRASPDDVARYVKGQIPYLPSVIQKDIQLQEEITTSISEAVDGMFLLAQIYLKLLEDKFTANAIRSAIEVFGKQGGKLSQTKRIQVLDSAYEQALERIKGQMQGVKKLAFDVLSWVTCTKRQLTTSELQHALATKPGKHDLDKGDLPDLGDMVSVCAGLVTVDEESKIIRLVHYTTQEYLMQTRERWFPSADYMITTTCVTYLSLSIFETGSCKTDQEFEQRLLSNPLYDYASRYWGYHAPDDPESVQAVVNFLQHQAKVEASSQVLLADKRYTYVYYSQQTPRYMTGLHLVGYFGVSEVVDVLVEFGQSPDIKDTYGGTPLWYAARNGHLRVVEALLAAGADVNAGDEDGRTALHKAAGGGHLEIVERLLAAGTDVNAGAKDGRTALHRAAGGGHLEIVERLLAAGTDVNAGAKDGRTALHRAAEGGHLEIVERLLAASADVNASDGYGRTALHRAAEGGHLEIVERLRAAGAPPRS